MVKRAVQIVRHASRATGPTFRSIRGTSTRARPLRPLLAVKDDCATSRHAARRDGVQNAEEIARFGSWTETVAIGLFQRLARWEGAGKVTLVCVRPDTWLPLVANHPTAQMCRWRFNGLDAGASSRCFRRPPRTRGIGD